MYKEFANRTYANDTIIHQQLKRNRTDLQVSAAPDIIPQGKIGTRFSVDVGLKKQVQKSKGEFYINASDLFNSLTIKKELMGNGFTFSSTDYYETQVIRIGYNLKF